MSRLSDEQLKLTKVLAELRHDVGDGEFGFRAQTFLAHTLLRMGAAIQNVSAQGHPDIVATLRGRELLFEVEVTHSIKRTHVLKVEDIQAIKPVLQSAGFLAVLDGALPASWVVLDFQRLRHQNLGGISLVTLHALSAQEFSAEINSQFLEMILQHEKALATLTFHVLRARALRADPL